MPSEWTALGPWNRAPPACPWDRPAVFNCKRLGVPLLSGWVPAMPKPYTLISRGATVTPARARGLAGRGVGVLLARTARLGRQARAGADVVPGQLDRPLIT